MNRKLFLLIALLACLALPLGHLAAEDFSGAPFMQSGEPNDTFATAAPLLPAAHGYAGQDGYIVPAADVDFYRVTVNEPGTLSAIALINDWEFPSPLRLDLALYNAAHTVLDEDTACGEQATVEAAVSPGDYTLRVRACPGTVDSDQVYFLHVAGVEMMADLTEEEPNDTMATANGAVIGQVVTGEFTPPDPDYPCDDDWYRFDGRKGDVLRFIDPPIRFADSPLAWLYDAAGNRLEGQVVLPADGAYFLQVLGMYWTDDDSWCNEGYYSFTLGESLWISAAVDGLGGDATIKRGDIVTRKTAAGKWQLVFDASDVGITANVNAIERMPNGTILMSLAAAQNVPGLGKVMPHDIIRFVPTSLGANTAGSFLWFLDGSDVGLTTTGEKIDAIAYRADVANPLRISITGAGSVPRESGGNLAVDNEDVFNFVQTAFGQQTAGAWRQGDDESTIPGMAAENLNALARVDLFPARFGFDLFVLGDSYRVDGVSGGPKDLLDLDYDRFSIRNLADKKIDALAVGPAMP